MKYKIKIWYWNYKDINSRYSKDNKVIHFEILDKNNNRVTLLNYRIPCFLNGLEIVKNFINSKYEVKDFIPCINYSNFDSNVLGINDFEIIEGEHRDV